ncbi:glycoside hydrolase family 97 protein [Bacteroides graminisolvens]|uniref:glycoside hydrolase family 97 protein n=1 Tax=Bacteroides graminisolvens TaxID=477666 RepID=UPI0029C7E1E1|nr:glycoside hydrolase family 97 protein [Bacteroides graminisolvens]
MTIRIKELLWIVFVGIGSTAYAQKSFKLTSPDGHLVTTIQTGNELTYSVDYKQENILLASPIALTPTAGSVEAPQVKSVKGKIQQIKQTIPSPFYRKSEINDHYNELKLSLGKQWSIEFRAYDDGVAYRFVNHSKKPFHIEKETVRYNFPDDLMATVPYVARGEDGNYESQFHNSFENTYTTLPLSELNKKRLMFLPLVVQTKSGTKVCITEADLENYPGLYLSSAEGGNSLSGVQPAYPKTTVQGGHNNLQFFVTARESYLARVEGARTFPWRTMIITGNDTQLAESDMTYKLASPSRLKDISWIKPGKVAWDWWNDWNIDGVDFVSGVNNPTYKYYIDFASKHHMEYVILDEGWSVNGEADLMQVVKDIDIKELIDYAEARQVSIILWAGFHAFNRDMENICKHYSALGVKGFKVDFMDRDDQEIVAFNQRAAETCARYKLILDLHGMYKPAGMNRTYPNVLNFEGVHGLEQMKWSPASVDQMKYDVTIPFIRQVAGPMDYTQGAMRNATRNSYFPCNSEPMSQGTRCHQLALYTILESPFNMLCDNPSNYMREPESLEFISQIPTVWDETRVLDGQMGEYIVTARRKGNVWYIGGITNWTERDVTVDFSFLNNASFRGVMFKDGVNAHRSARDYTKKELETISPVNIHMAPGGGFVMKLVLP